MADPGTLYVGVLSVAGLVTSGLAGYSWRHRDEPGATSLAAAMVASTAWTTTEILGLTQTGGSHLFWERIQWTAIAVVPLLFFFFMVDFTGHERVRSRRLVPLFLVVPVATIALALTNPAFQLMWTDATHRQAAGLTLLALDFGPWFWVYVAFAYTVLAIGFALLFRLLTTSNYLYLDQTALIVVGLLAPLLANMASSFWLIPEQGLDLTPLGFTVIGVAFGNALFRYRLFDLLPATRRLGRQAALVGLDDGVAIVDTDRTLLYLNPAAGEILDCDPEAALGESAGDIVDTGELNFDATDRLAELAIDGRTYEVETAPIADRRNKRVGHTILLYDVTERKRRERELRAQRDRYRRLERINTVIREVNQALVGATTVEELQRTVAETLATPGLYDEVWIEVTASDGPPVRMTAGDDDAEPVEPDAVPPELDAPDASEPSEGHLQTERDSAGGEAAGGDEGPNLSADDDWATVPLVYGRTVYGAIALHAEEDGFGERELAVLDELGETIGHALTAIERTHLLVSDSHVEIELQSTDGDALLVALADETDAEWTLDGLVPATEGDLVVYLSTEADDAGVDAATTHSGVSDVRRLATDGGTTLEVRAGGGTLVHPITESGANVQSATASDGRCRLTVDLSPDANVRAVVDRVREAFSETEMLAKREVEPTEGEALPDEADLTDRQREALEAAYRAGYFDWPRESTAEEVADSLDIAAATLHGHLRKAEGRLITEFFEE